MKYFELIRRGVNIAPLLHRLDTRSDLWDRDGFRKNGKGSPHSRMSDIWVRYNDKRPFEESGDWSKFNDEHDSVWYPAYYALPELKPIIFDLMYDVAGERLGGVLITRIPPGEGIAPHVDSSWHVEYYDKYYLSLKSAPGAKFFCDDEFINPHPGDIWKFDNRKEHWVSNQSMEDRITLIMCIRSDRGTAA